MRYIIAAFLAYQNCIPPIRPTSWKENAGMIDCVTVFTGKLMSQLNWKNLERTFSYAQFHLFHIFKNESSVHVNRQILFSTKRNLFPNKSQKKKIIIIIIKKTPRPGVDILLTPDTTTIIGLFKMVFVSATSRSYFRWEKWVPHRISSPRVPIKG